MLPTGEMLAAEMLFYRLTSLAGALDAALADAGHQVKSEVLHTPNLTQYLRTPVPGGWVILALNPKGAWTVAAPAPAAAAGAPPSSTVWPLHLELKQLLTVVRESALACLERRPVASPWCWGRTHATLLTRLADALLNLGVPRALVDLPGVDPDSSHAFGAPSGVSVLRLEGNADFVTLEVICSREVGWFVDYGDFDKGSRGRLDLRRVMLGLDDGRPDVPLDSVTIEDLAAVLVANVEIDLAADSAHAVMLEVPSELRRPLSRVAPTPREYDWAWETEAEGREYLAAWAQHWLRWCGFTRVQVSGRGSRVSVDDPWLAVHLHTAKSQVSLGVVQRAHAAATITGRTAVVVTATGASPPAVKWSEAAGVLLLRQAGGLPRPLNSIAAAYLPEVDVLPSRCDISECRTRGCQLNEPDMPCPDRVGVHWEWSDSGVPT